MLTEEEYEISALIKAISDEGRCNGRRYLEEFMDRYNLSGLIKATKEQLIEYIELEGLQCPARHGLSATPIRKTW